MTHIRAKHVVLIVFDYMGYGDIEPFGQCEIRTPNIKQLAKRGIQYTHCYAPSPICTPSRAAMLTGFYPRHLGIEKNVDHGDLGLPASQKTLARYFRDAGYHTALYGKWHLGHEPDESPNAHGFDDFLGFLDWNVDYYSHKTDSRLDALYHNADIVRREGYTTELFTDAAVDFISEKASEPYFLYVAYNAMLPPYSPPGQEKKTGLHDKWVNGSRANYVDSVEYLDSSVGRILDALEQQGVMKDTAVLLTYDHGGGEMATKGSFFHGFGTLWEGGIRVPMIYLPPGEAALGYQSSVPTILMDVVPTLLNAAEIVLDQTVDGVDLRCQDTSSFNPRTLYWRTDLPGEGESWRPRAQRAVRRGQWKYLWDGGTEFLYDVVHDPGERDDLGYRHPEILAELRVLSNSHW